MKRGAALLLIICTVLVIPGIILGARDKPFYLFWEMPFGLKVEDCLERVKREQQVDLKKVKSDDENYMALASTRKQSIQFFGYPVDIALVCLSRIYTEANVFFRFDEAYINTPVEEITEEHIATHTQKSVETFFALLDDMKAAYGDFDGKLTVKTDGLPEEKDFPMSGDVPDANTFLQLLTSNEDATLSVSFNNVYLDIQKDPFPMNDKTEYVILLRFLGDA